jgi:chaperonin GroES
MRQFALQRRPCKQCSRERDFLPARPLTAPCPLLTSRLLALDQGECQIHETENQRSFHMAFKPLHDRVLVRRVQGEEKTKGGLIIPDTAKEKPAEGEIVAVGEGARKDSGELIAPSVKSGDRILFGKWSGTEVTLDGEELLIMKESDILGIIA